MAYGVLRMRRGAAALAVSKDRLEARVIERTRELDVRNRDLRTVLDNVGQAMFTVERTGQLSNERSAALDLWFPGATPGTHLAALFGAADPAAGDWVAAGWEQVQAELLPVEVALEQLPSKLLFRGRHYGVEYRPINGTSGLEKVLVVISDVTEAIERSRAETDQREQMAIFENVMSGRAVLLEFFTECERLVHVVLAEPSVDRPSLLRAIHTLKGNAAMRGIDSLASVCHALEDKLSEPGEHLEAADYGALTAAWSVFAARVGKFTQAVTEDRLELTRGDLQSVRTALAAGETAEEIIDRLWALEQEPARDRLERVAEDARALAQRLGREGLMVTTEADDLRFDRERWAPFWSAFIHVLRNAIDHGIEPPDEREARGKPAAGRLVLRASRSGDQVAIEIADDGRGIDWQAVRARAQDLGRPADSESQLLEALFTGGISTREAVSEISGRGAGMAACKAACDALGGQIRVATQLGQGTTFQFTFPIEGHARPSEISARRFQAQVIQRA
jgi:two-component system chemotaxis sensor kinase CheA